MDDDSEAAARQRRIFGDTPNFALGRSSTPRLSGESRYGSADLKGSGYFGPLPNADGRISTELSGESDGEEYPLINPAMSSTQLHRVLHNDFADDIYDTAEHWARTRRAHGASPFIGRDELRATPDMVTPRFWGGGAVTAGTDAQVGADMAQGYERTPAPAMPQVNAQTSLTRDERLARNAKTQAGPTDPRMRAQMGLPPLRLAGGGSVKFGKGGVFSFVANAAKDALKNARPSFAVRDEAPFYRVARADVAGQPAGGIAENIGAYRRDAGYPARAGQEQAVRSVIASGEHLPLMTAKKFVYNEHGGYFDHDVSRFPPSSAQKQRPIAAAFNRAVTDDNYYPEEIYKAYGRMHPELMAAHNINSYDDLIAKAYKALGTETRSQFDHLPVSMSYHQGPGTYLDSKEMLRDVIGNNHLYVFQGGDKHPGLSNIDPKTGLNENEMFRAVHDYFGHAIHGNTFGPKGEETAWMTHQGMMPELPKWAMSTETRGQNSFVNYSGINDELAAKMHETELKKRAAIAAGENPEPHEAALRDLGSQWQYAAQKPLILPPEMLKPDYTGEVPDYVDRLLKRARGGLIARERAAA